MMNNPYSAFREIEQRYMALRAQLTAGQISAAQFQTGLNALIIQDQRGIYWTINPNSGSWMANVNGVWQGANPYPPQPPPPAIAPYPNPPQPVPKPRRNGCCLGLFTCGCLPILLILLCVGGGYLSLRQDWLSQRQIITLMGQGPGDVGIANLSTERLDVSVDALEKGSAGYTVLDDQSLAPGDLTGYVLESGRFTINFSSPSGSLKAACTIQVRSDDEYQFLADATGIYITRKGDNAQSGLLVGRSGLCRP